MSDTESNVIDLMAALKASLKNICPVCGGRGHRYGLPCDACGGTGKTAPPGSAR